jgi:DNA-binding winged helix-turn-helix (wHTH) protein/TolB-like protein/Tfp pilus assembly protein PilF
MGNQGNHLYEFDHFRLDAAERILVVNGKPVQVTPKALDTLVTLVRNNGHVVGKDQLIAEVWPDTFVDDNTLAQNISLLRRVLGQNSEGQAYIETVPKRGYRFVAGVRDIVIERHSRLHAVIEEREADAQGELQDAAPVSHIGLGQGFRRILADRRKAMALAGVIAALGVAIAVAATVRLTRSSSPSSGPRTIAILPFRNLKADADSEFLSLSLADAITGRLGHVSQIVARPSSYMDKYRNKEIDPREVARELSVDALVTGSFVKDGDDLRISAELIDVSDDQVLWRDTFDLKYENLLTVQDRVASSVIAGLRLKLVPEETQRLQRAGTASPQAYEAYLKGRYLWNRRTPDGFKKAMEYFNQAIKLDSNYALAYTGLADCYSFIPEPNEAKAAAERALEIDEKLAEAHASLGNLKLFHDYDWAGAEKEFKRSIELNPNCPAAHHWYAYHLAATGRLEEAIDEIRKARELDPLSLAINTDVGHVFYLARRYDEAIAACQNTLEIDPHFINAHSCLAIAYARKGMRDEAFGQMLESESLKGERTEVLAAYKEAYAASGLSGFWEKVLGLYNGERGPISLFSMALVYLELGENDQALELLEKSYLQRPGGEIVLLKVDPRFDGLRSNPRFAELLQRMNLG